MTAPTPIATATATATVDLDEEGRLLVPGTRTPVPEARIAQHLARHLRIPPRATDVYVYVHG